jgi:MYXO-CTERM domain-containing protein
MVAKARCCALSAFLFLGGLAVQPSAAFANGRFPRAQRLVEDRSNAERLLLAATYGLIITSGATWRLICETSYSFVFGEESDPIVDITNNGSILASAFRSLNRSEESGCHFVARLGALENQSIIDYSLEGGATEKVIAVQRSFDDATGQVHQLYESSDDGLTWTALGTALPSDSIQTVLTLDSAPSNRQRLYVSGLDENSNGVLLRSDDRGGNWTSFPIQVDAESFEAPYIAAVDRGNADKLYVRTDYWHFDESEGIEAASDRLLYSDDGGANFSELYQASGKLFGFALSPDMQSVLIGYGDPQSGGGRVVDLGAVGLYKSATTDFSFTKIFEGSITCLTWTAQGLYACTPQQETGFEVGRAESADFTLSNAAPFEALLRFADVRGPLDCPACTTGAGCGTDWEEQCDLFSACDVMPNLPPSNDCPEGGAPGMGGGASTGTGGGSGGSMTTTSGGSSGNMDAGIAGTPATGAAADTDGCGCRAVSKTARGEVGWLLVGAFVLGTWRRRRQVF